MTSRFSALQGVDRSAGDAAGGVVDPAARPVRRSFTAAYRARVIAEYEAAPHGQKAAVLRREGLYQSQVRRWTVTGVAPAREASAPRRRHRAATGGDLGRLRADNQRLTAELAKSQAVVEIMGKLLGYAGETLRLRAAAG